MATTHEINAKQRAETIAAYNAFHGTNIAYNGVPKHAFSFMFWVGSNGIEAKAPQEFIDAIQQEMPSGAFN